MRYIIKESTYREIIKQLVKESQDESLEDLSYYLNKCIDLKNDIMLDYALPEIQGQDDDMKNSFASGAAANSEYGENALDILFELITGQVRDKRRKQKGTDKSFDLVNYLILNNITDPSEIMEIIS
jgi:hypothetical protein